MTQNFSYQGYNFIITRKSDISFSIVATPQVNKSIFESGVIDLKKIKCDTVTAAFSNSNSKQLGIKLHYEEGNQSFNGQLLVSIIVKYQFLPEFSEEIILKERKLDQGDAIKVRLAKLQNQIDGVSKTINIVRNQGLIKVQDQKSNGLRENNTVQMQLTKGKYLIQISGLHKSSNVTTLQFKIKITSQDKKQQTIDVIKMSPYFICATYTYPFSVSELVELTSNSTINVFNKGNNTYNSTAHNFIVTAKPVLV